MQNTPRNPSRFVACAASICFAPTYMPALPRPGPRHGAARATVQRARPSAAGAVGLAHARQLARAGAAEFHRPRISHGSLFYVKGKMQNTPRNPSRFVACAAPRRAGPGNPEKPPDPPNLMILQESVPKPLGFGTLKPGCFAALFAARNCPARARPFGTVGG